MAPPFFIPDADLPPFVHFWQARKLLPMLFSHDMIKYIAEGAVCAA